MDEAQRLLVDLVWTRFSEAGQFPKYYYVEYFLRSKGFQIEAVLKSFPVVGTHLRGNGYRAVDWWSQGVSSPNDGTVRLTLAGLHHLMHDPEAAQICRGLLTLMRALTAAQRQILDHPFERPNLAVDVGQALSVAEWPGNEAVKRILTVGEQEWPGIRIRGSQGQLGQLTEANFHTTDAYLNAVEAALRPPAPPSSLPYLEPRALLRALNFLDVTCELVLKQPMVDRPPMDRSSLLALDVSTEAEYQTGLTVLSEILSKFNVPGKYPSHALGRLEAHLTTALAGIDPVAVHQAVEQLDQIRIVRNSFIHPKPSPELIAAHHRLGMAFPIRDFSAAWDSVRSHAEQALHTLQAEIQAAR